jgi:hypothetical protein
LVAGFLLVACSALATGQQLPAEVPRSEFHNGKATASAADSTQSQHASFESQITLGREDLASEGSDTDALRAEKIVSWLNHE